MAQLWIRHPLRVVMMICLSVVALCTGNFVGFLLWRVNFVDNIINNVISPVFMVWVWVESYIKEQPANHAGIGSHSQLMMGSGSGSVI